MAIVTKTVAEFVTDVESGYCEFIKFGAKKPGADRFVMVVRTANGNNEVWDVG